MDVRIGVTYTGKELDLDLGDDADADSVQSEVDAAVNGEKAVLWMTDKKGRRLGIPTGKIAYVEIGSPEADRRIGFST